MVLQEPSCLGQYDSTEKSCKTIAPYSEGQTGFCYVLVACVELEQGFIYRNFGITTYPETRNMKQYEAWRSQQELMMNWLIKKVVPASTSLTLCIRSFWRLEMGS